MDLRHILGATSNQKGSHAEIQRMHLLDWRFSAAEIQRLSRLQLQHREQPDGLDLSLDVCRLRFARWLAEHGRIGEEEDADYEKPLWEGAPPCASELPASFPKSPTEIPSSYPDGELASESGRVQHPADWRLALRGVLSRIRWGIARAYGITCEPEETLESPRGDVAFWGRYGWPYGGMRMFEIPSNWMHY